MAETLSAAYGIPAVLDQLDGGGAGTPYMLGNEVDVDEAGGSATHVTWYAPASAPGVTCIAKVYRVSDGAEVASSDGAGFTPTPGVTNQIALVTPFAPDDGEDYVACVLTRRYTFTGSAAFPFASSPDGVMHARRGRFKITTPGNPVFPDQEANTTNFHVGLVFERPDAPLDGTLQATSPAGVYAGVGTLIDSGAMAATASAAVLAAEGLVINPAAMAAGISGFSLSGAGALINSGTFQAASLPAVMAATNVIDRPAELVAGGSTPGITAGGTTPSLAPSGYP